MFERHGLRAGCPGREAAQQKNGQREQVAECRTWTEGEDVEERGGHEEVDRNIFATQEGRPRRQRKAGG